MKKSDLGGKESLDFRDLFSSASQSELKAACLYEYMRESQALRDPLNAETEETRTKGLSYGLATRFFIRSFTVKQFGRLIRALQTTGFPKPWQGLSDESRASLVSLLAKSTERNTRGDKELAPAVVIEEAAVELDHWGETVDDWYHWRLEPSEPNLLQRYEQSGRRYFFGFIRIDQAYNQTEAVEAFKAWFGQHREKTKGGNRERWRARLNDLVVMRLCNQFPGEALPQGE